MSTSESAPKPVKRTRGRPRKQPPSGDQKADEKKSGDKKSGDKSFGDKKPGDKKSGDKISRDKKSSDKKGDEVCDYDDDDDEDSNYYYDEKSLSDKSDRSKSTSDDSDDESLSRSKSGSDDEESEDQKSKQEPKEKIPTLEKNDPFLSPSPERNFRMTVENDKVAYVSKEMLASVSPKFKMALFDEKPTNAKVKGEAAGGGDGGLKIENRKLIEIVEFLHVLFPVPLRKCVDDWNWKFLAELADEFDVPQLKHECSEFMKKCLDALQLGDDAALFDIVLPAAKFKLPEVVEKSVPFIGALPNPVVDRYKAQLPLSIRTAVLDAKVKRLESEQHAWNYREKTKTRSCPFCETKSKSYCKKCWLCKGHLKIRCQGFHALECQAVQKHAKNCRHLEVDKVNEDLSICCCGSVDCLCGFKDFDKGILRKIN